MAETVGGLLLMIRYHHYLENKYVTRGGALSIENKKFHVKHTGYFDK